ncbi:MAG: CHAT domain-containing protein [Bacteroidota bacterium]
MYRIFLLVICLASGMGSLSAQDDSLSVADWVKLVQSSSDSSQFVLIAEKALSVAKQADDMSSWSRIYIALNRHYFSEANYFQAKKTLDQALADLADWRPPQTDREAYLTGWLYMKNGLNAYVMERFTIAIPLYQRALDLLRQHQYPNQANVARFILQPLGNAYTRLGDYVSAIQYLEEGLRLAIELEDQRLISLLTADLGIGWQESGNEVPYERVEKMYQRAIAKSTGEEKWALQAGLFDFYFGQEKYAAAHQQLEELGETHNMTPANQLRYWRSLADFHAAQKDLSLAESAYRKVLQLVPQVEGLARREHAKHVLAFATLRIEQQQIDSVQHLLRVVQRLLFPQTATLSDSTKLFPENTIMEWLDCQALLAHAQEDFEAVLRHTERAMQVSDLLRESFVENVAKVSFQAESHHRTERALAALWAGRDEHASARKAFQLIERSKAIVLQENIREAENRQLILPDSLQQSLRSMQLEKAQTEQALREKPNDRRLQERVFLLTQQLTQLKQFIQKTFPTYYARRFAALTSIGAMQDNIGQATLINYFWGEKALYVVKLDQQEVQWKQLALGKAVEQMQIELVKRDVSEAGLRRFSDLGESLYAELLQPFFPAALPDNLIILPDGPLHQLPFACLLARPASIPNSVSAASLASHWRNLPYLFKDCQLGYAWSAALLTGNGLSKRQPAVAFAPEYPPDWQLQYHLDEGKAVQQHLSGELISGADADTDAFRKRLGKNTLFHLALHAFADTINDRDAYLWFSGDEKLFAYEIYGLPLQNSTIVLSACETGKGRLARGEGSMSLGRAFRSAGASSLLMNLWVTDGQASRDLMQAFYQQLGSGSSMPKALQNARLRFLERAQPEMVHPWYWAGFVMYGGNIGDASPFSWWWMGGLFLLISVSMLLLYRRVK